MERLSEQDHPLLAVEQVFGSPVAASCYCRMNFRIYMVVVTWAKGVAWQLVKRIAFHQVQRFPNSLRARIEVQNTVSARNHEESFLVLSLYQTLACLRVTSCAVDEVLALNCLLQLLQLLLWILSS